LKKEQKKCCEKIEKKKLQEKEMEKKIAVGN